MKLLKNHENLSRKNHHRNHENINFRAKFLEFISLIPTIVQNGLIENFTRKV